MDVIAEDLHSNGDSPEIVCQQADVEEGRASKPKHQWRKGIEQGKDQRVACKISTNFTVPRCCAERCPVENACLCSVDEHAPKSDLPNDFVQWTLRNEELLKHITYAIASSAEQCEEISLNLITPGNRPGIRSTGNVVTCEQDAEATKANQYPSYLSWMVANMQEEERNQDDHNNGPEID